jgi:hypothetical protein
MELSNVIPSLGDYLYLVILTPRAGAGACACLRGSWDLVVGYQKIVCSGDFIGIWYNYNI